MTAKVSEIPTAERVLGFILIIIGGAMNVYALYLDSVAPSFYHVLDIEVAGIMLSAFGVFVLAWVHWIYS